MGLLNNFLTAMRKANKRPHIVKSGKSTMFWQLSPIAYCLTFYTQHPTPGSYQILCIGNTVSLMDFNIRSNSWLIRSLTIPVV